MFTPQQIEQVSFRETPFNGYNKHDVDQFLEPLTDDYIALYKENALLKSKMRVLVAKLEEYRQSEASLKDAKAPSSYQFMRLGYFCPDSKDSSPEHLVFNRSVGLKDSFKPGN